jgi:hypothetical protein
MRVATVQDAAHFCLINAASGNATLRAARVESTTRTRQRQGCNVAACHTVTRAIKEGSKHHRVGSKSSLCVYALLRCAAMLLFARLVSMLEPSYV